MSDDHMPAQPGEMPAQPGEESTAYLYLDRSRDITAQVQITESLIVDVDSDGRPVGVESLDGPINFEALLAIVRGSVLKGHVWPATVDGAATERPAEGTEQGEAVEDGSASPKVCGKCGTAMCLEDADRDFDWAIVADDPAPVVRTTKTIDPAELDRLLSAEAERQVLRGTVDAVRALHAQDEGRCTACVEYCDCLDRGQMSLEFCCHGNVDWPCPTIRVLDGEA